jgi:hypothetical protein
MHDLWLVKQHAPDAEARLRELRRLAPDLPLWQSTEGAMSYAYLPAHLQPQGADWHALTRLQHIDGASAGQSAPYHYVVETDVLPEYEEELNAWYAQEHLPGLAAVPGTVHAVRYRDPAGTPRYYACYDLVSLQTMGSAPWLAVRATAWSDRVRPAFRNTRRTLFSRINP